MPLKVIGAGYPRTGTLSLKLALEQLGFGPCHHMVEVLQHPEQAALWARKFGGEALDWDELLAGYGATTDAPTCFFYEELGARYPDAKIVLSIRSAESWWQSASATIMAEGNAGRVMQSPNAAALAPMFESMMEFFRSRPGIFPDPSNPDRDTAIAAFEAHCDGVRRAFGEERLLVFEARQGWEPLCRFLEVPVPDTPYPRANSREDFSQIASLERTGDDIRR
jgi:Sulfotransferase domain